MSTNPNLDFVGVVLAGGQSSRMGKDKALLELNGQTMMTRSVELLESVGACEVFVCRNEFKFGYLPDIYSGYGPLSGIHAALFATTLPLLVVPVDMPLLDEKTLYTIICAGLAAETMVHYQYNPLPLFVPNTDESKMYLEKNLSASKPSKQQLSIKRFLKHSSTIVLTHDDESKLANANTPDDWQQHTTLNRIIETAKKNY